MGTGGNEKHHCTVGGVIILTEYWPSGLDQSKYGHKRFLREITNMGFEMIDIYSGEEFLPMAVVDLLARYSDGFTGHTNLLCRRSINH
jgi:hypothetical protein